MKNKLTDLNNHLFAQLERLGDEELVPEQVEQEVKRTSAIVNVSEQIINNASLSLKAAELVATNGGANYKELLPNVACGERLVPDYNKEEIIRHEG